VAAAAGRPVSFGLQGSGQHVDGAPDPRWFREVAELAEASGFDSLWAGDHLSFVNPILELTVALSAFAAWTERILLGAGVLLLPLRAPGLVAKQIASLDYLSGGRVVLGVGVGGEGPKDFEAAGVPAGERGARADEGIAALRVLFAGGPAAFSGRFYRFEGVAVDPPPVRPGGPPILVGGRSDAALRRAGRLGDGWLAYMVSPDRFARDFAAVRRHAEDAGRDPGLLEAGLVVPAHVGDSGRRARRRTQEHLSRRYGRPFEARHVERYCVVGTPEECRERLEAYAAAGVRHVVFNPAGPADGVLEECRRLAAEVVAPLREDRAADRVAGRGALPRRPASS
jgi:probable F420-dependent oxidoreductase